MYHTILPNKEQETENMENKKGRMEKMENKRQYLVYLKDEECAWAEFLSAYDLFNKMNWSDCSGIRVTGLWLADPEDPAKGPVPCIFNGKWHNSEFPLKMTIVKKDGTVLDEGYGTDH